MASPDIATQATWQINCSQGNKRILRMKSWDISDNASVEAVLEVGSDFPVGFKDVPGAKTLSLEIRERKGVRREIDYHALRDDKEMFGLTKQVVGGIRTQYPQCRVSKIDEGGSDDAGEIMYTVEIIALRERAL